MRRFPTVARPNWQQVVESQGLVYHTTDEGEVYWNESAYYSFWMSEIEKLEAATNELQEMCLKAGQYIIDKNLFRQMNIDEVSERLIRKSWEEEPPAIYGRFDLAYNGSDIKLLEYNADTPTSLLESSVIQWYWLKDQFPVKDQFNSIHERLVAKWRELRNYINGGILHLASLVNREDAMTIEYLSETARQAGIQVDKIPMDQIGYDRYTGHFVDLKDRRINTLFKLYPWENLMLDEYGKYIETSGTQFMEPAWKMMWSNKALLAVLWKMFPGHKYLLPAYFDPTPIANERVVRKPFISREGANISVFERGSMLIDTEGPYGAPFVYQKHVDLISFDGKYPIIGSWVIDGESAGIGIREDSTTITGNTSQFVPHFIE